MKTLLRIDASARTNASHTRKLADHYQTRWEETHPQGEVILREQIDRLFLTSKEPLWIGQFSLEEKKAISALRDGQANAIVDGDAAAYAELCAPDIQLMIPGHDTISGRDQVLLTEANLFRKASFTAFKKFPERIERSGDMIVETGSQEVTMKRSSVEGGVFAARQKYMHMFRLTSTGWRYAVLMSNHSEQPRTSGADRQAAERAHQEQRSTE